MMRLLVLSVVAWACGGGSSPTTTALGPPAPMIASGAAPDDVIVAQVAGRPVWGSCVATQAKRAELGAKQALEQCIEFELLAQAAEAKQLAIHGEVIEATRVALVGRLVDQFDAKYPTPDSMAAQIDEVYRTQGAAMTRPEFRQSTHILVKVEDANDPKAPKQSDATWEAPRVLATQLHARLEKQTGLFGSDLREAIEGVAAPPPATMVVEELPPTPRNGRLVTEYLDALFAIPEVGRVSPVTRTAYGYHVILLTALHPAETATREQVFAVLRGQLFATYVAGLMKTVPHESYPELLEDPAEATSRAREP